MYLSFFFCLLMDLFWTVAAKVISIPFISNWIIRRAMKTPYYPITKDGELYMGRYWLFNPYFSTDGQQEASKYKWWPWNIRVHHICMADRDKHHHDHPWNARTIILKGWYNETRLHIVTGWIHDVELFPEYETQHIRKAGDTARIDFGQYHSITQVPEEGVWTLFISGPYQGTWGFWVNKAKMQWRQYLGIIRGSKSDQVGG